MSEVKLHGNWSSHSTYRVIWALSLKDIPYEYVEEDLTNESNSLLLHYKPLHQKVPLLVHGGKTISESTVILEYIDETWPQNPLFPVETLDRATARFWIQFIDDKGPMVWRMFCSGGKEQKKAKQETLEMLQILEEEAIGEGKFFGGEKIGMVDLAFGQFAEWLGVIEEVIGEKLIESESFPRLEAWSRAFMEAPAIRENRPDRERMVATFKLLKDRFRQPSWEFNLTLIQCVFEVVSLLCRCF